MLLRVAIISLVRTYPQDVFHEHIVEVLLSFFLLGDEFSLTLQVFLLLLELFLQLFFLVPLLGLIQDSVHLGVVAR